MLKPCEQWYCDTCGEVIECPSAGYVEWLYDPYEPRVHTFRIVHHFIELPEARKHDFKPERERPCCYQHENNIDRQDLPLTEFVGSDGLVQVVDRLLLEHRGVDLREWAETCKRLQTPYYEEARQYFDQAEQDDHALAERNWLMADVETLKEIVERYQ